jgi:phenylacetic acid degradation operon negative regulatory protein
VIVLSSRDDPQSGTATLAQAAAAAWDLPALAAAYRRLLSRFGAVIDRFRQGDTALLDAGQCFVVRSLLIHAYRRAMLRDPQLPSALLPLDWPGRRRLRTDPRFLPAHAAARRAPPGGDDRRPVAAGIGGILRALRGTALTDAQSKRPGMPGPPPRG